MMTKEQKDYITANYSLKGAKVLAAELGLTIATVRMYAYNNSLHLDPKVRHDIQSQNRQSQIYKARLFASLKRYNAEQRALKTRCPELVAADSAAPVPGALQDNKYYRGLNENQRRAAIGSLDDSIRPGMTAVQIADAVRCRSMLSRHQSDASASFSITALNFT